MDMKFLPTLGGPPALELIENCMAMLKRDYQINLDLNTFEKWPGRLLTFEEYLTMILVEKDLTLKYLRRNG